MTNNLEPQDTYSIRGLNQATAYDLKVNIYIAEFSVNGYIIYVDTLKKFAVNLG